MPLQSTPLLGREEQVATLAALLRRDDVRLVTLSGPGGIGKTRLAIHVATEVIEAFPDGVWFVRLSRLVDPGLVVPTIAQTLSVLETGSQPIAETLRTHMAEKRLLLVLDNFEQVMGAAGDVATLLEASLGLRVLVTSRLSLHLRGEREYPLVPLPVPDRGHLSPPDDLSQYAAVALFIARAQATKPAFAVTAANAPALAEICARLDGLPLAIELAAARVRVLPPEALLARLSGQLKLLTGGARDLEERQQTMRATLAWSENLLAPAERMLLRRVAVFVGGCTLEAAEAVCAAPEGAAPLGLDLLDGLAALVDHSLVQQREEAGEARFAMLQVVREYALEQLEASGESQALAHAHASFYLRVAEQAELEQYGTEATGWLARVERELDNLRAALGWARDCGEGELGLRLAEALTEFWPRRGYLREGRRWLEELLALAPSEVRGGQMATTPASGIPVRVWVRAMSAAGVAAANLGDYDRARALLEQSLEVYRELGNQVWISEALTCLAYTAGRQGDLARATTLFEECLVASRQARDPWHLGHALANLADAVRRQGNYGRAASIYVGSASGIFYRLRHGGAWRSLPREYRPWSTVFHSFRRWRLDSTWARIQALLREEVWRQARRASTPRAASIDNQSVTSTEQGGPNCDAGGKQVNGASATCSWTRSGYGSRSSVHPATRPDRDGAKRVRTDVGLQFPRLVYRWADHASTSPVPVWTAAELGWSVEIVERSPRRGFPLTPNGPLQRVTLPAICAPLPRQWVVERALAWIGRHRRISKDDEQLPSTSAALVNLITIRRLRRLLVRLTRNQM